MSGYDNKNRRRRGREFRSPGGGGSQKSSSWNSGHYSKYQNYDQFQYPRLTFPEQWNSVSWRNQHQYSGTYGGESVSQSLCPPQQPFSPSQGHSKTTGHSRSTGHSSSLKSRTLQSKSRHWDRNKKRHSSSSTRSPSFPQQKVRSPPLGSEEARKKTLAQATNKIRSCLLSFQNEKSKVLENLLSNEEEQGMEEPIKATAARLEKPGFADIRLTPNDLKVTGVVNTFGTGGPSELDEARSYPSEIISTNEFLNSSGNSDCSGKDLISTVGFRAFSTCDTESSHNVERDSICKSLDKETGLKHSSKSTGIMPHCIYKQSKNVSETNSPGRPSSIEDTASNPGPCAQSRSAPLSISNAADDFNQTRSGTNIRFCHENPSHNNKSEPERTLKDLKHRIIQQFLKMGKNNLKDLINNPRSRKFEFAMNHLMKEHRLLLSRELRGLAQSRIRGQDVENQGQSEPVHETSSLLDTDIAINLSHLPQEIIEQLGSLLQLDLLDNAESLDFQPISVESETIVHDMQNIQALQVALLSEENIKKETVESERKDNSSNAVEESQNEGNLVEGQHGLVSDSQLIGSKMDVGAGEIDDRLKKEMENERDLLLEGGGTTKKARKESDNRPDYIPLGKGFMNRSSEFGNLFCEYPGFLGMESVDCEAADGRNSTMTRVLCTQETNREITEHAQSETARSSNEALNPNSSFEANEARNRTTDEMTDCDSFVMASKIPSAISNKGVCEASDKSLSNTSEENSVIERFATGCLTITDVREKSCSKETWIEGAQKRSDGSYNTPHDNGTNFPASNIAAVSQAKDIVKGSAGASEPIVGNEEQSGTPVIIDRNIEGSADSHVPSVDHEPLEYSATADRPAEGLGELTDALFKDNGVSNANVSLSGTSEGVNIATNTAPNESEIRSGKFEEMKSKTVELPKENVAKEDSTVGERQSNPAERMDSNYVLVENHIDNLQRDLNTAGSNKIVNSRINTNEESVENKTSNKGAVHSFSTCENQNGIIDSDVPPVNGPQSEAMDTALVLTGNDIRNTNCNKHVTSNRKNNQLTVAEHGINSNDTAEVSGNKAPKEIDTSPSQEIQAENISIDELYGDMNELSIAEDTNSSAMCRTKVSHPDDNDMEVVTTKPVSEEGEEMDGSGLSIMKNAVSEDGCRVDHTAEGTMQSGLHSTDIASGREIHDKIMEVCHHNVVVKTEKTDDAVGDRTSVLEEHKLNEGNNDAARVDPEFQNVGSLSHNHLSSICNPLRELTAFEVGTQTQPPDELDSDDVQRMLQLLEKSSQLSPELAKLLKDHFSSRKITEENESLKLPNSVQFFDASKDGMASVPQEKSPSCSTQPLCSEGSLACISEIHNTDSAVEATTLPHTSGLSYPLDGMEPRFRGPSIHDSKEKKNATKGSKLTGTDKTSTELNTVQKVIRDSKESEDTASVSSLGVTDTRNGSSAAAVRSAGVDGENTNPLNTRRDAQEGSLDSNSKYLILRMLEIDKEIKKLMEVKLELYGKLQLNLEVESSFSNRNNNSPKSRGLQYSNPTTVAPPHTLCNRMTLSNNSSIQQMHMGFVTMNNNELMGTSFASDRPTSTSTPMVMLPIDYVLGSSSELQNTHLSLPRHKLNECLKTFDTSVVEAVLNSFNLPDCQNKEDSSMIHSSDHNQNKILGDVNEMSALKSKSDQMDSISTNKGRRYFSSRDSTCHKESHKSERKSLSPKAVNQRKPTSKSKPDLNKKHQSGVTKKHHYVQHKTGISRRNRLLGNREKSWIESNSDAILRKPVHFDSLNEIAIKELRSRRQTEIYENKNQQNEGSRSKHTRQTVGSMKYDKESSQSDSNVVEVRKETHSSDKTQISAKNNKQETDSLSSSNRPRRHSPKTDTIKLSEQFLSQTSNSIPRGRRDAKTRSLGDVELLLEDNVETVSSRKEIQSSTGGNSTSFDESEASDCTSRVTRKRKLAVKTEIIDDECITSFREESSKPAMEGMSRRSSRVSSALRDMRPLVLEENATEIGRKRRTVKMEQTDAVVESTLPARKLKKATLPSSGQLQKSNNTKAETSPGVGGVQKRKQNETESPPSKVLHHNQKMGLLQWNLQDCFVMVQPLAIGEVDESNKPCEKLAATNSLCSKRIRTSSHSSDELSVAQFVKKNKNEIYFAGQDIKHKSDNVDDCYRITFPESADGQVNQRMGSNYRLDTLGDGVIFPESADEQLNETEDSSNQHDPLGDTSDSSCQALPPKLHVEPYGNITSSPMQLPPDLIQSNSPGRSQGQCIIPEVATQDENSISTIVSDTLSVTSDGEQPVVRRIRNDGNNEAHLIIDGKDDCDQDSTYSCSIVQEGGEGTNNRASKHKSSRKHRKERKSDSIERLMFESHKGPILDIKTVGRHVLAASEDGNVYCYSLKSGKFKRKYEGHRAAVTCLCVVDCNGGVSIDEEASDTELMAPDSFFTGSLDKHLRNFRFKTGELVQNAVDVGNPIQCIDQNCGIVYIGTQAGEVARFSMKTSALIGEPMKIGKESILTLKATKEGPRQVLIIGSRNKPIAVRDAATGLLLRTVCNNWSHTVYSLVLSTGLVYCGTKTGSIPAIEFSSGDEVCRFQAATGVVCMRIYNNLLFAGCYDGNIYVFSIRDKSQVTSIPGPGKMLLCMDIVKNRIIAGSKDSNKLEAWGFPHEVRNHVKEAKHR